MNRNWAADWQPEHVQGGAGDFPFCFPETKAISQWILKHPNIAAGQSYHNAGGMILRGPGANYLEGEYVGADRATYDSIANVGAEMLPFYRSMVIYQDLDALIASVREANPHLTQFETSCFDGKYITGDITTEYLRSVESQRNGARGDGNDESEPNQLDLNLA